MSEPNVKEVNSLFAEFHNEFENTIMDMLGDRMNKETLDVVFSALDELQEEYHNKLGAMFGLTPEETEALDNDDDKER